MPFHRRFGAPVKRDKHEVVWSNLIQNASTVQQIVLANTVDVGGKTGATDCAVGSHVKGIYLEFHFSAESIANAKTIQWSVVVLPPGFVAPAPSLYYDDKRSYVIQRGMEMLPRELGTVFKRIIFVKIPKLYQRRKQGDFIVFNYVASSTDTINACGIAIYKESY